MFDSCSSLTSLDLSSFNTENITTMSYMFRNCSSLTNLDLSNFNTNNVNRQNGMQYMFNGFRSLKTLNLGKKFIINEGVISSGYNIITENPSDIKVTTTRSTATELKKYSNLTDSNFIFID